MAELPIVIYGDPVLREVAQPVDEVNQEVKDLVSDMADTLKKAKGLGLAASQVGEARRLFMIDLSAIDINESLKVFINPEIVETSGEVEMEEGCLSFPELYLKITRPERVLIRATDTLGKLYIDLLSPLARTMIKGRLRKLAAVS